MEQFESHEEELNSMSFGLPQAEIDKALSLFKNQLIKEPFKYDNWKAIDGLKYLVGIYDYGGEGDSQYLLTLANVYHETNPSMYIIRGFLSRLEEFRRIWDSGNHPEKAPPNYFVEWALSKKLAIHWLQPALEQGLIQLEGISAFPLLASYAKDQGSLSCSTDNADPQYACTQFPQLDPASPTYPSELDVAIRAWVAVSTTAGKGKPKKRILDWLKTNHPGLSNEAMERIAVVGNWDKKGGATSSD